MQTAIDLGRVEEHFTSCADHGMPRDQAERFLSFAYTPTIKQQEFHAQCRRADTAAGPKMILFGGSRAGGKTHGAFCQAALDDCQRYPDLKGLFLRRIQKSAKESFNDLCARTLRFTPNDPANNIVRFSNGSYIIYGGIRSDKEIDNYVGQEYDFIIIEELTQFTEEQFNKIRGSLRTSRQDGWRVRMYLTTNPGNVGHVWVKEKFVLPYRRKTEKETVFIPAKYTDNPYIDPEYANYLNNEISGALQRMWRDGDWDIQEGRAFPTYSAERNYITWQEYREFVSAGRWMRYGGIDYGVTAPYCGLWGAYSPVMGRIITYREDYGADIPAGAQADRILALTPADEKIDVWYADPSLWGSQSEENKIVTTVDYYMGRGLIVNKGDNKHINGKRKIDSLLEDRADGYSGFLVVEGCENLNKQMMNLQRNPKNVEDIAPGQEEHAYDACRMMITNVRDVIVRDREMEKIRRHPLRDIFAR